MRSLWLAKQVKVTPVGESNLFKIVYQSKEPNDAAAIVNAITESYFKLRDQSEDEKTQKVIELLEKKRDDRQKELSACGSTQRIGPRIDRQEAYTAKPDRDTPQRSMLADLQARLVTAQVDEEVLAARIEAAERELQDKVAAENDQSAAYAAPLTPAEAALRSTMVEQSIQSQPEMARRMQAIVEKENRQREIERLMVGGKNNPDYIRLARQINDDRQDLARLRESLRPGLEQQAEAMLKGATKRSGNRREQPPPRRTVSHEGGHARARGHGKRTANEIRQGIAERKQFKGETLELEFKRDELERAEKV